MARGNRSWPCWLGGKPVLQPAEPLPSTPAPPSLGVMAAVRAHRAVRWLIRSGGPTRRDKDLRVCPGDQDFMPGSSAAAMEAARPHAHWILWSTLSFILVALIWASQAQVDEVTVGHGHVIPSSKIQVVQ